MAKLLWQIYLAILRIFSKFLKKTWRGYAFERYKQQRQATVKAEPSKLHVPSAPGLVSIVLPVYNGACLVGESLDSILAQTYPNFEVIAINDGSTDHTAEVLDAYAQKDSRIRVVHQANAKLPRSLSNGFRLARGQYLTWTSDDNHYKPDFLARMVAELERHSDVDMAFANLDIIDEDGKPLINSDWYKGYQQPSGSEHIFLPKDVSELNIEANNSVGAAFLYRDRVAWLLGDYSKFRFTTEDYDYWMQVNALFRLRHASFDDPVYEYRFHSKSLTSRDKELEITSSRAGLMVFDDFRRDFYTSRICWTIQPFPDDERAKTIAEEVKRIVENAGQTLVELKPSLLKHWARLWIPTVSLSVVSEPEQLLHVPADLPPNTYIVALFLGKQLPAEVPEDWDFCIALGDYANLPRLTKDFQGWLASTDLMSIFFAVDVRARVAHLRLIEEAIFHPNKPDLKASIIICTYLRHDALINSIKSTACQTMDLADYEVIVGNNAIDDPEVEGIVNNLREQYFAAAPDHLKLIQCPLIGLSHARNAAISESRGEILYFLDDDALAGENWIRDIYQAFQDHPEAGVIGGPIRLVQPEPRPEALHPGWEKYWGHVLTSYTGYTQVQEWYDFPWGSNWCAPRKVVFEMGGFRTRYGRYRKGYAGGEEIIASALVQRLGYSIAILPQAEVLHVPEASRFTYEYVQNTIRAGIRSQYGLQKDLYIPMSFLENWRSLKSDLRKFLATGRGNPAKKELHYRLKARVDLLRDQVLDILARMRKIEGL